MWGCVGLAGGQCCWSVILQAPLAELQSSKAGLDCSHGLISLPRLRCCSCKRSGIGVGSGQTLFPHRTAEQSELSRPFRIWHVSDNMTVILTRHILTTSHLHLQFTTVVARVCYCKAFGAQEINQVL